MDRMPTLFTRSPIPSRLQRLRGTALGLALTLVCCGPAVADDTEIFASSQPQARPNIMFILDTSGSMRTTVQTQTGFEPSQTYTGAGCDRNLYYWRLDIGTEPVCTGGYDNWVDTPALVCDAAVQAIAQRGFFNAEFAAQWDPVTSAWVGLNATVKGEMVECAADAGTHGPSAGDPGVYAANGTKWTADPGQQYEYSDPFTDRDYVFYSGNYLNWLASGSTGGRSRLEIMQDVASNLVQTVSGVNVGLMRYSSNGGNGEAAAEGGMVTYPITPVESARNELETTIRSYNADGFTPLSETLYEAHQYYAGRPVQFGLDSEIQPGSPFPSVPESRVPPPGQANYKSPADQQCQESFIVYLTDGLPTRDNSADDEIETLRGTCNGGGPGRCLDDLADYMRNNDINTSVTGTQRVTTYTVGFGPAVAGSPLLAETARRGGGEAFAASDGAELTQTLNNIVTKIQATGTTFVSPAVAVNSFNRTETLSDLYVSVFEPGDSFHWAGNLKKYAIDEGVIVDADGNDAINAQGFFDNGARSIWSATDDGPNVLEGGATEQFTDTRNIYTFQGGTDVLSDPANAVTAATDVQLGLDQPGAPSRANLLSWIRGTDVLNTDGDGTTTVRREMGDPLHGRPAIVVYGGTEADPDAVIYVPTNDGYLHAINSRTGAELWAFIPVDLLRRLPAVYADASDSVKHYGLDGDVRAFKTDVNGNGFVDGADQVIIVFGMRRGGNQYFALDVTSKTSPRQLWTLGPAELPGIGQTWSTPTFARVAVEGASPDSANLVLIFGGGYDTTQDNDTGVYSTDAMGHRIYMVDALSGELLWYAGGPGGTGTPDLGPAQGAIFNRMNNSIPAGVRVIDLDGDTFADRLYAADTGGRVWRFDITLDADPLTTGIQVPTAAGLATGGLLASLANADQGTHPIESTRRFYHTPDVALIRRRGADPYFAVSLGSGWRGHPLDENIEDRFYSLRDYAPFTRITQAVYNSRTVLDDDDLPNVTDSLNPVIGEGATGWKLELRPPQSSAFEGEKVLAESRTFDNVVFFPSYRPTTSGGCGPAGRNRAYAVAIDDGRPVLDINNDGLTLTDRYTDLAQGGIAPEISFLFPRRPPIGPGGPGGPGEPGGPGQGGPLGNPPLCSFGLEIMQSLCASGRTPVRTYWRQTPP